MKSDFLLVLSESYHLFKVSFPYFVIFIFINFIVSFCRFFARVSNFSTSKPKKYILSEEDIYLCDFKGVEK